MAAVKVVDLQKKKEELQQAQEEERNTRESALKRVQRLAGKPDVNELGKSDCVKTNMNINYAIMQAREQLNDAVKKLMAKKDSNFQLIADKV